MPSSLCPIQGRYELGGLVEDNLIHLRDDLAAHDPRLQKFTFYRMILLEQDDNDNVDCKSLKYNIILNLTNYASDDCEIVPEVEYTYSNVPRSAICIVDKPYSSSMS